MSALLNSLIAGENLASEDMETFIGSVMDGKVDEAVIAAVLVALRIKGETGEEVAAAARAMRSRSLHVPITNLEGAIDTCGTGGDGMETVNISTAAALVAAAAGIPVAKHGNRSVSSRCGSADVLEHLGVRLDLGPDALGTLIDETGIAFLFAPRLHPAIGAVMPVRRSLGIRTIFNMLGPITNPAGVGRQLLGTWSEEVQNLLAAALADLGARHALIVHSLDGLDEFSVSAPTRVLEVRDGCLGPESYVNPKALGIPEVDQSDLKGGDASTNAERLVAVLSGKEQGAAFQAVALNSAGALVVGGKASDLHSGLGQACDVLASGRALEVLNTMATRSRELAGNA